MYFFRYVTGLRSGSWGALLVPADWQVRVFGLFGIVDRPSERLYIHNIPLYVYMDRLSCRIPFSPQARLSIWQESLRHQNSLKI